MITGAHVVVYSKDAESDRTFFRDILKFPAVDAGQGWLISACGGCLSPLREERPARAVLHVRRPEVNHRVVEGEESEV